MDRATTRPGAVVLGISAYHPDSAACIVVDGVLVAASEEERFTRIKHWAGLPALASADCLRIAGVEWDDVEVVAVNSIGMQWSYRKMAHIFRHRPSIGLLREKVTVRSARKSVSEDLAERFGSDHIPRVVHVEHHDAHLASAFLTSGWSTATLASIDGFGDFSSAAFARASGNELKTFHRVRFPHSLGVFYQAMTHFLGFRANGDEYKVMGLAAHGEPRFQAELSQLVRSNRLDFELDLAYFRHHTESLSFITESGEPTFDPLYSRRLVDLLGSPREPDDAVDDRVCDLAASVQTVFEDVLFATLNHLSGVAPSARLGLAGGCALNAVAVGKIREFFH